MRCARRTHCKTGWHSTAQRIFIARNESPSAQRKVVMIQDLSRHSAPISSFLSLPKTPADWRKYRLSDEQVAFYHEFGYLSGIRILTDEQVEQLRAELQGLFDPNHP